MTWQTAIDTLRAKHFGESDSGYDVPTEACKQRVLAWMEARAIAEPMRCPARVGTLPDGGLVVEFSQPNKLEVEFENDGCACWYEWRDDVIVASGKVK